MRKAFTHHAKAAIGIGTVAFALAACGTSAPALPSGSSDMYRLVTSQDGDAFLRQISIFDWPDDGSQVAGDFAWISEDAASQNSVYAIRAGEAAFALASFLAENASELLHIPHGFLELDHSSIGELNGSLVEGYATALAPFMLGLAGNSERLAGFDGLAGNVGNNLVASRDIFSVIATDVNAGSIFVNHSYSVGLATVRNAAESICVKRSSIRSIGPESIRDAAILAGLAASIGEQLSEGGIPVREVAQVMDDVVHAMASICIDAEVGPLSDQLNPYIEHGKLISPEVAVQRFKYLESYYQSQRDYLASRGLSLEAFTTTYRQARGD